MMILMNGIGQRLIFRAQPEVEKFNLKLKKKKPQAPSSKLQALSLTKGLGFGRIKKSSIGFRTRWGW